MKMTTSLQDVTQLDPFINRAQIHLEWRRHQQTFKVISQHRQLYTHHHNYLHKLQPNFDYILQKVQSDDALSFCNEYKLPPRNTKKFEAKSVIQVQGYTASTRYYVIVRGRNNSVKTPDN
jgi:hypothetical protein